MYKEIKCSVNGREAEITVGIRESLTDMLRERLHLESVKKGCEAGECGACTVLLDGKAVNSCLMLAHWADGKSIITVEGLTQPDGGLHPVQRAFVEEAAIQCGFCTPGFILRAVEIVGSGKKYSAEELRQLIAGNLCRCTGYGSIINAIEKALQEASGC